MTDLSDQAQGKAIARKVKAARVLASKLEAAYDATVNFSDACRDCGEDVSLKNDTRIMLMENMGEYARYLRAVHGY